MKEEVSSGETKDSQEMAILHGTIDAKRLERGLRAKCENIWAGAETKCQDGSCCSREMDTTDTTTRTGSGQGSGRGRGVTTEIEVARVSELGTRAMTQLEEAGTIDVFKWIVQHMIESMREEILQVVAGKDITGAQIRQAMSQSGEEDCRTALHELFEYRVSVREVRALDVQL